MIRDLDDTIKELLTQKAEPGSELSTAEIEFDIPDADWRNGIKKLTVNCYLYDVHENGELKNPEPWIQRSADGVRAARRQAPVRIDCSYLITAWSVKSNESIADEHRLLGQVLTLLLKHPTLPPGVLVGSLTGQPPPYPTVVASQDGMRSKPEFWGALDQQLKPSLNYVVTLALFLDDEPSDLHPPPSRVSVHPGHTTPGV